MVDVFLPQHLNSPLGCPRQFLVNVDVGIVGSDFLIRDVYVAPGQPQDLAHAQRTSKGKVHGHIEFAVRTFIQRLADHNKAQQDEKVYDTLRKNVEDLLDKDLPTELEKQQNNELE